eukprot:183111_1
MTDFHSITNASRPRLRLTYNNSSYKKSKTRRSNITPLSNINTITNTNIASCNILKREPVDEITNTTYATIPLQIQVGTSWSRKRTFSELPLIQTNVTPNQFYVQMPDNKRPKIEHNLNRNILPMPIPDLEPYNNTESNVLGDITNMNNNNFELPEGIPCIVYPLTTRPLRRQLSRVPEYHPEDSLISILSMAQKEVKIAFAYFRNDQFAEKLSRFIQQLPAVKWQIILGESSVTDINYKQATNILVDIATEYPERCVVKVLFGGRHNNHFGKMHWKFASIDKNKYYIGSWQPTKCANENNEEIGAIIMTQEDYEISVYESEFDQMFVAANTRNVLDILRENPCAWEMLQQKKELENQMNAEIREIKKKYMGDISRIKNTIIRNNSRDFYAYYSTNSSIASRDYGRNIDLNAKFCHKDQIVYIVRIADDKENAPYKDYQNLKQDMRNNIEALWDKDAKNRIVVGDFLGFIIGAKSSTYMPVEVYQVIDEKSTEYRKDSWEERNYTKQRVNNVGKDREVIVLSPICTTMNWVQWRVDVHYKERFIPRGTMKAKNPFNPIHKTQKKKKKKK